MPELPEVETIKKGLLSKIKGKQISGVKILFSGKLNMPAKKFTKSIRNTKIMDVSRRAKILILTLSNNLTLLIHLKMTGQLIYESPQKNTAGQAGIRNQELGIITKNPKYKYARVVFYFTDKSILVFNDLRKFGYIKLIPNEKIKEMLGKEKFGPEPLEDAFTLDKFKEILKKYPNRRIKQFLMDQAIIAGIGNIYSDEICYYAKVNPSKQINNLTIKQIELLFEGIKKILRRAIELRGSSVDNYVDTEGEKGDYVKELKVYDREGEKCFCGKGIVKRIKLGGRSSYFCPECQK